MNHKSIEERLRSVFLQFLLIAVLLGLLSAFAVVFYSRETARIMDSLYYVEEFFALVEDAKDQAQELLVLDQEADATDLALASQDLSSLERMRIGGNYLRNMQDLRGMFENFVAMQREVQEELWQGRDGLLKDMEVLSSAIADKKPVLSSELQDYYARRRSRMRRGLLFLGTSFLLTFFTGFLALWKNTSSLAGTIVQPVKRLSDEAGQIRGDELSLVRLEVDDEKEMPQEILTLYDTFTRLLGRIAEQMEQLKETMRIREELKEKELENLRVQHLLTQSELRCLQMQMNPHFLFNTLNMISQTLYLDQKEKTAQLLKETASFLRYSLDYVGKNVTLGQELEGVGTYVALQEERLGERVFFEFILDEELDREIVPCLILQPLVENSLIHGVSDRVSGAEIQIVTERDAQGIGWIRVRDNGRGIPPKKLAAIREGLREGSSSGQDRSGLSNVARRLELFEYCHARLWIDREEGGGTEVSIRLEPLKEERREGA